LLILSELFNRCFDLVLAVEFVLLGLRILIAVALYAFLGAVLYFLLREQQPNHAMQPAAATLTEIAESEIDKQTTPERLRPPRTYTLIDGAWLGRDPNCLIRVNDTFASARHACVHWVCEPTPESAAWWIEDNDSRNGTLVNGERVMRAMLKPDDVIRIGDAVYRFALAG